MINIVQIHHNDSLNIASLKHETVLPILEHVDEIRLASVDGTKDGGHYTGITSVRIMTVCL